ncbi:MAG: hypothetical protein ABIH21_00140 [Patescibacteria group bacterium]
MDNQFKRILRLVKSTGDRMIVTDPDGENIYVIMGFDQYENLIDEANYDFTEYGDEYFDEIIEEPEEIDFGGDFSGTPLEDDLGLIDEEPEIFSIKPTEPEKPADVQAPVGPVEPETPADIFEAMAPAGSKAKTWNLSQMSENEVDDVKKQLEQFRKQTDTQTPELSEESSKSEENKAVTQKNEDDFSEEQFYLEPIE